MVSPVNGSGAAAGLGILRADATEQDKRDGQIDGGQLLGVKLTDRFFMTDATLVASLEVTTPGGIDAGANFGFIGVNLGGDASLTADFTVGLKDPTATGAGHDGNISLTEFINGLSDVGTSARRPQPDRPGANPPRRHAGRRSSVRRL